MDKIDEFMKKLSEKIEKSSDNNEGANRRLVIKLDKTTPEFKNLAAAHFKVSTFFDEVERSINELHRKHIEIKSENRAAWFQVEIAHGLVGKELKLDANTGEVWEVLP